MLDFIVLGLVPGTSIQLTFGDVVRLACIVAMVAIIAYWLITYKHRHQTSLLDRIRQIAL